MKLTINKEYEIDFNVCYHESTEGGMDYGSFGVTHKLEDALDMLLLAEKEDSSREWEIVLEVTLNEKRK